VLDSICILGLARAEVISGKLRSCRSRLARLLASEAELSSPIKAICVVGRRAEILSRYICKNISGAVGQIAGTESRVLSRRGALANVINAARDAVDAESAVGRTARMRTGKS
jgi:hypothetical protein